MLKFVCGYFFTGQKTIFAKTNPALLAQKLAGKGNCQNPLQVILRLNFFLKMDP